jgi:cytochrome P450
MPASSMTALDRSMLNLDPPDHTRLRTALNQLMTRSLLHSLEPAILRVVDQLIAPMIAESEIDFVKSFALPLPVAVISELLGIPESDRPMLQRCSAVFIEHDDSFTNTSAAASNQAEAIASMSEYCTQLAELRTRNPGTDLLSGLLSPELCGQTLTLEEVVSMAVLLIIAGHETTVSLLSNGLFNLLRHPGQLAALQNNPGLVGRAIEEMLRHESPIQRAMFRVTVHNLDINGFEVRAGEQISAIIGSANRDETVFPDADSFDIERSPNRHLAFGAGVHVCAGMALARLEAKIAFHRLLQAFTGLDLVENAPVWKPNSFFRGLESLVVHTGFD